MERFDTPWILLNLEHLSDWAEELKAIPGTTVTSHRKLLAECGARVTRLSTARVSEPTPSPPRRSSRIHKETATETSGASIPVSRPLKTGETFINAVRVSFGLLTVP